MIAIAESGSTKTDWFVIDWKGETKAHFFTQGFNPDFHSAKDITEALEESKDVQNLKDQIEQVYFFGASCSSPNHIQKVTNGLSAVYANAKVDVDHDLLACAYALTQGEPMITCILGTGSNSAYFDGKEMREEVPALGFFLGDEASGAYYGKNLIRDFFYKKLPADLSQELSNAVELKWSEVREKIYGSNRGNAYLASFMPFIYKHRAHPYFQELIERGIREFVDAHVNCFKDYPTNKVGFVGTLSHLFEDTISKVLCENGFQLERVIKGPGSELVKFLIEKKQILQKVSPESVNKNSVPK